MVANINLMEEGLKLQQAIIDANKKADEEQELRDRMKMKHRDEPRERTINGSADWHDSGHSSGDFK